MTGTPRERFLAWSVHFYTALGAPIALATILATIRGDVREAFLWMALAIVIDSTDGALARAARVKEVVPEFDGARLDDVVDYLNYVLVPIFFAVERGMLPEGIETWVAAAPLLASAYGFCNAGAKTADFFFTGFPSYWNVFVFYAFGLDLSPSMTATALLVLAALVFVPIGYLYPSRQPFLRPLTITLAVIWGAMLLPAVFALPERSPGLLLASLFFIVYYAGLSLHLHFRRRPG
ncbi:MAG: CDP-alcohol phosphatidyltransferase family protein [Candidatus Binatia bacterium]